ncbi:insulinase family protein [Actinomadura sp. GC306]|uniref:insulinase family protein n=1 Tax=Actinomadura sp. GC306 TaxID=2530367 RepID=UPI00104A6287|nr:insulinase family protein [Actinomadura sp. GC306]TDC69615.1 insulinase family protein [Actinomadura sp. GC306]
MDVVRAEVDGVPVFWTEGRPGDECQAALVFRVGRADETLARGGMTHLVEHLTLHAVDNADYHYNGIVESTTTMFVTKGEAGKVAAFLAAVCDSLRALPLDRLDAEKNILRTEAEKRDPGAAGQLLTWRYGAATYGLPAYPEHGLTHHTAEDVQEWAARWFTRQNAALALIGGPPPEGLRLVLPEGERRPVPAPTSALPRTPAYFHNPIDGIALTGIVQRSVAATLYTDILERRLHHVLRRDGALSYTTKVQYDRRGGEDAEILAYADGLAEVRPELTQRFLAELDRIAAEPVDAAELAEAVAARRVLLVSDEARASRAMSHCLNELVGGTSRTTDELLAELDAVKPQDVQEVGRAVLDSALLMLPPGEEPQGARFSPAPTGSTVAVEGPVHTRPDDPRIGLVVGPEGATLLSGPEMATVRFDECAAVLGWPDGARVLIGLDGLTVGVEPNHWHGGRTAAAEIDRHVPEHLVVAMPARSNVQPPSEDVLDVAPQPVFVKPKPARTMASHGLIGILAERRRRPPWDDAALKAVLPRVGDGDLRAGLELLARTRDDGETRCLYLENLTTAAAGQSAQLAHLAATTPGDPEAQLLLGAVRIEEAWQARSAYRAEYVTEEQFGQFWQLLSQAGPPLHRAAALLPADPAPWERLIRYGIGMQLERDAQDRFWQEVTDRHPFLYAAHMTRSQTLARKWWGSDAELLDFAESAVAAAPPGDPVTAVLALAHIEIGGDIGTWDDLNAYLARPRVHAALADAADRWQSDPRPHPRALEAHQYFGAVFYRAGDHDRARHHLARAGRTKGIDRAWGYAEDSTTLLNKARRHVRA